MAASAATMGMQPPRRPSYSSDFDAISYTFSLRPVPLLLASTMRCSCDFICSCRSALNFRHCVNALVMRAATWGLILSTCEVVGKHPRQPD